MENDNIEAIIGIPYPVKKVNEKPATDEVFAQLLKRWGRIFVEKKSDGNRVQIHVAEDGISLYSSGHNLWNLERFPELFNSFSMLPLGIYDAELLGKAPDGEVFPKEKEFSAVQKRRQSQNFSENIDELIQQYPLKLDIFDVLNMDGNDLTGLPLAERRQILEETIQKNEYLSLSEQYEVSSVEELRNVFTEIEKRKLEGIIVKDPESAYVVKSDNSWYKLKLFTDWDVVVLGTYQTENSIEKDIPFSALLCGVYNQKNDNYETLVKLPVTGEKKVDEIHRLIKESLTEVTEENIHQSEKVKYNDKMFKIKKKIPAYIINPEESIVVEIKALRVTEPDNTWHSCGIDDKPHSLELSSYKRIRYDKTEALRTNNKNILPTTTEEILEYLS